MSCTLYFNEKAYKRYRNRYRLQYRIFCLVVTHYDDYYRQFRYHQLFENAEPVEPIDLKTLTLVQEAMWQTSLCSKDLVISVLHEDGYTLPSLDSQDKEKSILFLNNVCDNYVKSTVLYLRSMRNAYIHHMMDLPNNKCLLM